MDCGVNHSWAACQAVARRMLRYLDSSEALKVDAKELEDHVLAPHSEASERRTNSKIVPDLQQTPVWEDGRSI